ncbi:MAG: hypothetical protein AAF160_01975 [Pseudomonadota bacterium]
MKCREGDTDARDAIGANGGGVSPARWFWALLWPLLALALVASAIGAPVPV